MLLFIEDRKKTILIYMGENNQYISSKSCKTFLNQLCVRYGSTYEGRRRAAGKFLHIRQKIPIYVKEDIILFPSLSADAYGCFWINYWQVQSVEEHAYQTRFIFYDGTEMIVDMEYRSALMQMRRCAQYLYALQLNTKRCFVYEEE